MEKRLNKKIEDYISQFKNDLRDKVIELDVQPSNPLFQKPKFIHYLYI